MSESIESIDLEMLREIVFGSIVARSIMIEDAETIAQAVAQRIWWNVTFYVRTGDWADRLLTVAEREAGERAPSASQALVHEQGGMT